MDHAVIFSPSEFQQFLSKLKEIIKSELKGFVVEEPMTTKEAASYLNISESALWKRIKKGQVPADLIHRSAGSVYFFPSELHQFIKSN